MRAARRLLTAASIAVAGVLGVAGEMAADCQAEPPAFEETVASAERILIGDVVAVIPIKDLRGGVSGQFTIQVSHVVRGDAVARLDMSNEMAELCGGKIIVARVGDRIALAFGATAVSRPVEVTGVAWIVGQQPGGFETTTVEDVYRLAGVPMPETTVAFDTAEATPSWLGPAVWGIAVAGVLVIVGILGRRLVTS